MHHGICSIYHFPNIVIFPSVKLQLYSLTCKKKKKKFSMAAQTERPPLTAHIETWTGQDVSIVSMTHEVVSRLLLGAVEVVNGDTEDVRAHHAVGAAGQTHPVQCPVQRAGEEAELRAQRARGCKTGAYTQDRILRGDHCYIWVVDKHTGTHWYQLKKPTKKIYCLF